MKTQLSLIQTQHRSTARNYLERVAVHDKAKCAEVAKLFGKDYWDGDRKYGYGGYRYDGRWSALAEKLVSQYQLNNESKILDVGCGKGFLLYEINKIIPHATVAGIDVSAYAIENSKGEIRPNLKVGNATQLEFPNQEFDLVISLNVFHNLYVFELFKALREFQRVSKGNGYLVVESYRNEKEKVNLLYWQLTCESFYNPDEWRFVFDCCGYLGDYEFIYFE